MICAYCGTSYSDSLPNCPSCGANAAGTEKAAAERELFSHKEQANPEKASFTKTKLRGIRIVVVLAALALLAVVVAIAYNAGKNSVLPANDQTASSLLANDSGQAPQPAATQGNAQGSADASDAAVKNTAPPPIRDSGEESYKLGKAYVEKGDYEKAIIELKKVSTDSAYDEEARALLDTASTEYVAQILETVHELDLAGEYASGIALLRSARKTVSSAEISLELNSAEASYFAFIVDTAKAAYFSDGAESAITVVAAGISVLPEDNRLQNLKALFEGAKDTPAYDVKHCSDLPEWWELFITEATDSYGDEHNADILHLAYRCWSTEQEIDFNVYEKYSSFSADIFVGEMEELARSGINVYCDNQLVFSTGDLDRRYRGGSVNIDLSGVYCMKIVTRGIAFANTGDSDIYLENPVFHKELSEESINQAVQ